MKQIILIISTAVLLLWYIISSCNTGATSNHNSISTDPAIIAKGQAAFTDKCSSCHNFYLDGIGPKLAGVTSENSVDWIKNFIKDPI